mmetsp:Transcript_116593/g.326172  ORF Transcript_116593/g.326172 Transcript_116593/m.326172 type:complete len:259 (+) Transcript_116593:356-1132(+)
MECSLRPCPGGCAGCRCLRPTLRRRQPSVSGAEVELVRQASCFARAPRLHGTVPERSMSSSKLPDEHDEPGVKAAPSSLPESENSRHLRGAAARSPMRSGSLDCSKVFAKCLFCARSPPSPAALGSASRGTMWRRGNREERDSMASFRALGRPKRSVSFRRLVLKALPSSRPARRAWLAPPGISCDAFGDSLAPGAASQLARACTVPKPSRGASASSGGGSPTCCVSSAASPLLMRHSSETWLLASRGYSVIMSQPTV